MNISQACLLSNPPAPQNATKDYCERAELLRNMDVFIRVSGVERELTGKYKKKVKSRAERRGSNMPEGWIARAMALAPFAIRCNILRRLTGSSYREFSVLASDSPLIQWFLYRGMMEGFIGELDGKWLSKSSLERYDKVLTADEVAEAVRKVCAAVSSESWKGKMPGWNEPLSIRDVWADCSCLEADIHFPVDWVLLRDVVRTLVAAIICLRNHGMRHRIRDPRDFLRAINAASIEMAAVTRGKRAKKKRKQVLRKMKRIVELVRSHAERYRNLAVAERESRTDLTEAEMAQIVGRIDSVLSQLPAAIKQAEDRIIREQKVPDPEKVLSLYEPNVHAIFRGKSSAAVEFGNTLYLAESRDGLIVDFHLYRDRAPADCKMLEDSVCRIAKAYGGVNSITTDRGFDSPENRELLSEKHITNNILPKSPRSMAEALKTQEFRDAQKRRAQIEGRIGILKNVFIKGRLSGKGFEHQEIEVSWCILVHNLWVVGRIARAAAREEPPLDNHQKTA